MNKKPINLFYSYSHKDEALRDTLETHLKLLQRQNVIDTWHDRKIISGTEWDKAIDKNLEAADIILLLISADFLASDYFSATGLVAGYGRCTQTTLCRPSGFSH